MMFPPHSRSSNSDEDSGCALEEYAWCPPGLKAEQVRQFFKCFPEEKVPFLNSIGEKHRTRMLEEQLPPHDTDPKYCRALTEDEKNELRIFNDQQRHNALGRGVARQLPLTQSPLPCRGCPNLIDSGSICVHAERIGRNAFWHPQCFTCRQCKEFLVNLIYFGKDGQLYCGRHHAEQYKPRCTACDEIIFSDECTEAEGFSWHMDHFCCLNCKKRLGGERYVMRQNQPFCLNCFETMYAEYCDTCGERIETDQPQMAHESQHWHATDACFYCYTCRVPLLNRGFYPRYGALFCSNECSSRRNQRSTTTKQRFDKGPDIIPTSFSREQQQQQHVRIVPGRVKSSKSKEQTGYVSDGPGVARYKRETNNGYMSDGTGSRRQRSHHQPQVFLQLQTSPESMYNERQTKLNISRTRSREPIQFYNDLNLEQLDRDGATLEIARCSTSKSSRASLPDLSRSKNKRNDYSTISQETLVEQPKMKSSRLKNFDSNEIMYPISRPKATTAYSTISAQFPRSRSLNGSARFTKQHHVRFVDDVKTRSPTLSQRSKKISSISRRRTSSSSSSSSDDEEEKFDDDNAIYRQFDIYGNRLRRPMTYGTKISYVDECGLGPNTMKKIEKKSTKKKKDCIIS